VRRAAVPFFHHLHDAPPRASSKGADGCAAASASLIFGDGFVEISCSLVDEINR
jgi:hypothetical protein